MALQTNALTLLATVKSELGISDTSQDTALERRINAASDAIERHCRRRFARAVVAGEKHRPTHRRRLVLDRTPLVEVTEILVDGAALAPSSYRIEDPEAGFVWLDWPPGLSDLLDGGVAGELVAGSGEATIEVDYTGGWVTPTQVGPLVARTLPADLEEACLITVVSLHRQAGRDQRIESESVPSYSAKYATGPGGIIPDAALVLIDAYRRPL